MGSARGVEGGTKLGETSSFAIERLPFQRHDALLQLDDLLAQPLNQIELDASGVVRPLERGEDRLQQARARVIRDRFRPLVRHRARLRPARPARLLTPYR